MNLPLAVFWICFWFEEVWALCFDCQELCLLRTKTWTLQVSYRTVVMTTMAMHFMIIHAHAHQQPTDCRTNNAHSHHTPAKPSLALTPAPPQPPQPTPTSYESWYSAICSQLASDRSSSGVSHTLTASTSNPGSVSSVL